MKRRQWLTHAAVAALARTSLAAAPKRWPTPNLAEDQVLRCVAGIRPYRKGGVRIEREEAAGKALVHNYGHGGAGYTLSWGSAKAAVDLVKHESRGACAVLGAGVVGLSTAALLLEAGFAVHVYAQAFPPHTTSDVAGAEWSPDIVDRGETPAQRRRFDQMLLDSWHRFMQLRGDRWCVYPRAIYEADDVISGLDELPAGIMAPGKRVRHLPFAPHHAGRVFQTLLIEAPAYLQTLTAYIKGKGAVLHERSIHNAADVSALKERLVFNCIGMGAAAAFADEAMVPIRGQLVHLRPQALPYILDHVDGYVLSRRDALILGGSFEAGVDDPHPDNATRARILQVNRRFFARS